MVNKDLLETTVPIDKSYVKTFVHLFMHPEQVMQNEETYVKPFKYASITVAIPLFLSWSVNQFYASEWVDWATPKRLRDIAESYDSFRQNFDSIVYMVFTMPIVLLLLSLLHRRSTHSKLRIATYLTAQLLFIIVILFLIPQVIQWYVEGDSLMSWSVIVILTIGFCYYLFFSFRVFGRTRRVLGKAVVSIAVVYIIHLHVSEPLISYGFHRIMNKSKILFYNEGNITPDAEFKVNCSYYRRAAFSDNAFHVVGDIGKKQNVYLKVNLKGKVELRRELSYEAIKILTAGTETIIVGRTFLQDSTKFLIIDNGKTTWKYRVNKKILLSDAYIRVEKNFEIIYLCGFEPIAKNNHPRLIVIKTTNDLTDVEVVKDTVYESRQREFRSVYVGDSSIFVSEVAAQNNEISEIKLKCFDIKTFSLNWESTIFSKSSKYSPYHHIELTGDEEGNLFGSYTVPNDTNTRISLVKINQLNGEVAFSKRIDIAADDVNKEFMTVQGNDIVLVGYAKNLFSPNPLLPAYTLAGAWRLDKSNGNLVRSRLYGGRLFESHAEFISAKSKNDTLYVFSFRAYQLMYGAYIKREFDILKFTNWK